MMTKNGFNCHPRNLDGWMVIKKIQLLATKFGKKEKGACNIYLESSRQALLMMTKCN
jgi:hypothetical protein